MKHTSFLVSCLSLLLLGCSSTAVAPDGGKVANGAETDESAEELREVERKLEVARAQLALAKLELESFEVQHEVEARHAAVEADMARARLARFLEVDRPNRLASAELDLQASRDRVQEAADELAQIEIMYAEQDLDDMTAEFVVGRGRRQAERAAARLQIQEAELAALAEHELMEERAKLELAVDRAHAAVEQHARDGAIGREGKKIGLTERRHGLAQLETELAELLAEAKP